MMPYTLPEDVTGSDMTTGARLIVSSESSPTCSR
jgi:hypothetical protein